MEQGSSRFTARPRVLVVENKRVVAATVGASTAGVAKASLRVPASSAKRLLLVRDDRWVRPMPFDILVE